MKAIKVTTDLTASVIDLEEPLNESLKEAVGGWIEVVRPVRMMNPFVMIADEEGLLKGLEINPLGSYLYATDQCGSPIVGSVLIMKLSRADLVGLDEVEVQGLLQDIETFKLREVN